MGSGYRDSLPQTGQRGTLGSAAGKEFIKGFFEVVGKVNDVVFGYQTTVQIAGSAAETLLLLMIS